MNITFADVAGVEEAKQEVVEIVDFLKDPGKFQKLGGKIPKGVLMVGSPGTGKTLLARAIAGEAKVPFFTISGSDFVEMFVGVGASRVRDMFEQAKKHAPCIIFIDEIDAVGRHRGAGLGGGHDEREQTLNQLLVEMDGFEGNEGIIVIAATNRPDVLDPALLRPGRFDRQVVVPLPDVRGREQILKVHMRKVPLGDNVKPSVIARGTPGFSGADLANLVNEAALFAARGNKRSVTMEEFERAKDKIMMGAERRSMVMTEEEKRNTAYHESGHAIVGLSVPEHDPVYKVTIIPRGRALGVTMFLPEQDRYSTSKRQLESRIATLFGGRVAEELVFGADAVTTGASNDIERATELARNMVTRWGLSDRLGPQTYSEESGEVFLGRSVTQHKQVSDVTAHVIDEEVRRVIDSNYQRAYKILQTNMDKLQAMSEALIKYETIDERADQGHHGRARAASASGLGRYADADAAGTDGREAGGAAGQSFAAALRDSAAAEDCAHGAIPPSAAPIIKAMQWRCRHRTIDLTRPVVMGILNVTPDSFSDGNRYATAEAALARAARMVEEGAAIIDVGGESTRPGADGVEESVETARVVPVIEGIARLFDVAISIDSSKPGVMAAAAAAGACIVNDVYALRAPGAREWAAAAGVGVCLMHMQGEPRTMQNSPRYGDVVAEVIEFLVHQKKACLAAGIASEAIVIDPGLGFGKGLAHNLTLMKELPRLAELDSPVLVGMSRKSFIGRILGRAVEERLYGGLGLAALAVSRGARIVRTHDVAATRDAIGVVSAVLQGMET